jgi:hypothetical protein
MGRSSVLWGARGGSRLIPPLVDPEGSLLPQLGGRDGDVLPLEQLLAQLVHHCHIARSDQIPACSWQGSIWTGNSCQFPTCARNQQASWASRSCSAASRSCGMTVGASPEKSKPHGPGAEPREEVSLGWHIVQDVLQGASGLRGDGDPGGLFGKCSELRGLLRTGVEPRSIVGVDEGKHTSKRPTGNWEDSAHARPVAELHSQRGQVGVSQGACPS